MKPVYDNKLAVGAFDGESLFARRGCLYVSGENNDVVTHEGVFGLRKALIGNDFSEGDAGGVGLWSEERHGFVELGGESGTGVILKVVFGEDGGVGGAMKSAKVHEVVAEPSGTSMSESLVDGCFVEGEVF